MRFGSTPLLAQCTVASAISVAFLVAAPPFAAQEKNQPDDATAKITLPFVSKHCISCHGDKKPKADLSLSMYKDEKALIGDRKVWEKVLRMVESGEMPPQSRPQPKVEESEEFVAALYELFTRQDAARRDPGRVVMRRLNKAEYANSVRDLLHIQFNPTEDFPNDDVGGGFDNNGAVLTLSPLLMERYLDAAERVVQQAFPAEPNWPAPRRLLPNVIQPAPEAGDQRDPRMLRPGKKLFTNVKVDREGPYAVRALGWHIEGEWGVPKLDIEVDDKVVKTVVSVGQGIGLAAFNTCSVDLKPGPHKLAVSWPIEYMEPAKRDAFLEQQAKAEKTKADEARAKEEAKGKEKEEAKGKEREPKKGAAKDAQAKQSGATPDFEQGYHLRWFEFAGPGVATRAQKEVLAHTPGASPKDAAREVISRFATRAFRRPAQPGEVDRFLKLADGALAKGEPWQSAVGMAIQAILVSPKFLFLLEIDDQPETKGAHALDEYQFASRLSYFLWSSIPDDELLELAGKRELQKNLAEQVQRMLKDKKADALSDNFASQWLHLRLLQEVSPDVKQFPEFDLALRQAMQRETLLFFDSIVREDRSILDLIDANYTFLNDRLAKHYGIADTKGNKVGEQASDPGTAIRGPKFVRVQLQGNERGGILTQASILTVTSNPTRTNPVKRGKWVLEQILNAPPPPPPPNVPELATDQAAVLTGSLRQRMEKHRADPACANCHARMDPLGFAFEQYDAVGKFRLKDGDFDVDASGELPGGRTFKGAAELKAMLTRQSDKFVRCFAEKMLVYALGRGTEFSDRPAINKIVLALRQNGYKFSTLVTEIAQSDPFRLRRGKDQPDE
jgi:hypothetical protein